MAQSKLGRTPSLGSLGEWGFLDKILPRLKGTNKKRFLVPPGDDAAVMRRPARAVLSIDGLTENTHFKCKWAPWLKKRGISLGRALGWKLLGSNLSDLAAMGETDERWALVFLGGPARTPSRFLLDFYQGLREKARRYDCALVGGDTVRAESLTLVAAVGGVLKSRRALTRTGTQPGDFLCVAGFVGDAERGLQILQGRLRHLPFPAEKYFVRRFFDPLPLFYEGQCLAQQKNVVSLLDLSDSLYESINILLREGTLGCKVDIQAIPTSSLYKRFFGATPILLAGGEDYALLFTARKNALVNLKKKMNFSVIGQVLPRSLGRRYLFNGRPITPPRHFQHFN